MVTEDDRYGDVKRSLCAQVNAQYVVLPKVRLDVLGGLEELIALPHFKDLDYDKTSTTEILQRIRAPLTCPLRVDFGGQSP